MFGRLRQGDSLTTYHQKPPERSVSSFVTASLWPYSPSRRPKCVSAIVVLCGCGVRQKLATTRTGHILGLNLPFLEEAPTNDLGNEATVMWKRTTSRRKRCAAISTSKLGRFHLPIRPSKAEKCSAPGRATGFRWELFPYYHQSTCNYRNSKSRISTNSLWRMGLVYGRLHITVRATQQAPDLGWILYGSDTFP